MNQPVLADRGYTCEEVQEAGTIIAKLFAEAMKVPYITDEKEAPTVQVTYNGFTGELVKLEKKETGKYTLSPYDTEKHPVYGYDLSIYDSEKQVTHSFTGVKMEDMTFLFGAVTFGG